MVGILLVKPGSGIFHLMADIVPSVDIAVPTLLYERFHLYTSIIQFLIYHIYIYLSIGCIAISGSKLSFSLNVWVCLIIGYTFKCLLHAGNDVLSQQIFG